MATSESRIKQLENRIQELENWKAKRERQQLSFPLDTLSNDIVKEGLLSFERNETGVITEGKTIVLTINGKIYKINAEL